MLKLFSGFTVGFFTGFLVATSVHADEAPAPPPKSQVCKDLKEVKAGVEGTNGSWVKMDRDQWEFARGVYSIFPDTPPGLPYGDGAVLIQDSTKKKSMVVFVDGDLVCTPMPIPEPMVQMLLHLGDAVNEGEKM